MKYAFIAAILLGGGIGLLISPAFELRLAGFNLLGFVPVLVGVWLIDKE